MWSIFLSCMQTASHPSAVIDSWDSLHAEWVSQRKRHCREQSMLRSMSTSSQIIHFDSLKHDAFLKRRQGIQDSRHYIHTLYFILYTFSTFMIWWRWYDDLWFYNSVVLKRIGRNTFLVTYTYTTVNCVLCILWSSGQLLCSTLGPDPNHHQCLFNGAD